MEIQYQWVFEKGSLGCVPIVGNYSDYVVLVNWRYRGTLPNDDPNKVISVDQYGQQTFQVQQGQSDYVPFAQLTEEIVIGWLTPVLNVEAMEESIANQIDAIVNPPIVYPDIPWTSETNV